MTITVSVVVMVVAYVCGAITKAFLKDIPDRYIPIQNVIVGILSGIICFFVGLEENIVNAIIVCLMSALSAGGVSDLLKTKKTVGIDEITWI